MDENGYVPDEWERLADEPARWYQIFVKYYLGAGLTRTLRKAFLNFKRDENPEAYEIALMRRGIPAVWVRMATKWQWHDRAQAFDSYQTELSMTAVTEAAKQLRELAPRAVQALALALASDKFSVAAAKEILDRGGLPSTTRSEVAATVKYSSEDLAAAEEEAKKWEKETFEKSG